MCILLVEDNWLIRTLLAEQLMDGGFAVREAEDGDQASILIVQDPTAFTLLVTDIHMPGSLDGCVRSRATKWSRAFGTGTDVPLRGFQDGQHGRGAAQELHSAMIGGHVLVGSGARVE